MDESKPRGLLGKKSATPWAFMVWDGKTNQFFPGIVLRDSEELKQVETYIRNEVHIGGGATIRALSSDEMRKWWSLFLSTFKSRLYCLKPKTRNGGSFSV